MAHKTSFVRDNDALLERAKRQAALYLKQPKRLSCMTCDAPIGAPSFLKLGVPYSVCDRCGHLNGHHVDTDEFCAALYTSDGGKSYAASYSAADREAYETRARDIYAPKVGFLLDGLRAAGERPERLKFADLGAGSGYMLAALADAGHDAQGYEVSSVQIEHARSMRPSLRMHLHEAEEVYSIARDVEADVVTMIGVLEHLQRPRDLLAALRRSARARFLYLSVPLLSLSVYVELAFPDAMPRHLSGGHTHLYTDQSLRHLSDEFGMERVAEWWFGLDVADLYRSLLVSFGDGAQALLPALDEAQAAIDRGRQSSEVHMLFRLKTASR